jgi:hypothetical protein
MSSTPEEILKNLQQQMIVEHFKSMVSKMVPKCFTKCILSKPGLKLSSSEEDCLESCAESYQTAVVIVNNIYMKRIKSQLE